MSDLSEADLSLVRWVADARVGSLLPEPWRDMKPNGTGPMVQRLVDLGVVHSVYVGMPIADAALAAQADCREWRAAHPDE